MIQQERGARKDVQALETDGQITRRIKVWFSQYIVKNIHPVYIGVENRKSNLNSCEGSFPRKQNVSYIVGQSKELDKK